MHMAVEGPTTQQLNNDDKHREYMLNMNAENLQKWKDDSAADAPKWEQIKKERTKTETEERDQLREKWLMADTETRMKNRERDGEMGRGGGGGIMNGGGQFTGMGGAMLPPHAIHPQHMQMYARMGPMGGMNPPVMQPLQPLQHPSLVGHLPTTVPSPANASTAPIGVGAGDSTNSRKRPSTTPSYEDHTKRMMMDSAAAHRYPPGSLVQLNYPSYSHYPGGNGGPYGMPSSYNPPACALSSQQQQQQQMQQSQMKEQDGIQGAPSFPSMSIPSTCSSTVPSHSSPMTSSSSTVPPPSTSSVPSQSEGTMNGSNDDLEGTNADNVEGMINGMFCGQDLGPEVFDDEWNTNEASTSMGGPSSLPPSQTGGEKKGVVLPPSTSSAPHSNQMPTPGGKDDMGVGGGPSSSSTHGSPINGYPHPSPHQGYGLNGLMNHVSSVGAPSDSVQSSSSSHAPRTPTTSVMGPPTDSSTPFPHMSHSAALPPHMHGVFPMTSSSHNQPSLLPIHPLSGAMPPLPAPTSLPSVPVPKKRSKKAAAPKQSPAAPPPNQLSMNGSVPPMGIYPSMVHPSMANQFAPPPNAIPPGGMPPQIMDGPQFGGNGVPPSAIPYHQFHQHQMMMMRNHPQHQMMMAMHMRHQGMVAPSTSSATGLPQGMLPSPQGGMIPTGPGRPSMPMARNGQPMMSPTMMLTPQQQQQQQQHQMFMMQQQRMQQMRFMSQPFPMDPQQQAQMQMQQHQMQLQQQQMMQQQQQHMQQQQQGTSSSGQGSPMVVGGSNVNVVVPPSQQVSSPFNPSIPQISPAYTHTSAPFPFASSTQYPPINPSQ